MHEGEGTEFSGEGLHDKVEQVLHCLSFSGSQIVRISTYAKEELSKATNYKTLLLEAKYREFNSVAAKIEKLEEKMLNDVIDPSTNKTRFARLSADRGALENEIITLKRDKQSVFDGLEEGILLLCNMRNLYISTTLEGQQMLLKKVFEVGIKYDGKVLRPPMINPALVDNYLAMKKKELLLVEQSDEFLIKNWSCTAYGSRTRHSSVKERRLSRLTNAAKPG